MNGGGGVHVDAQEATVGDPLEVVKPALSQDVQKSKPGEKTDPTTVTSVRP